MAGGFKLDLTPCPSGMNESQFVCAKHVHRLREYMPQYGRRSWRSGLVNHPDTAFERFEPLGKGHSKNLDALQIPVRPMMIVG